MIVNMREVQTANLSKDFLDAINHGDKDKLKNLCDKYGIEDWTVFRQTVSGQTALHIAARGGNIEIVKFLCNNFKAPKFKIDVTDKDVKRPLHEACQFARSTVVDFLIDNGASVDALKRSDWTPLMLACTKDCPDAVKVVQKLIKAGANTTLRNKDGWMPSHIAARTGNIDILRLLLEHKPESANAVSKNGRTALHIAVLHGHVNAAELLISINPNLLYVADSSGSLPIHEAVKSLDCKLFERLIGLGADLTKTDFIGHSILHVSAAVGNIQVINYVLNKDNNNFIDINSKDTFGTTPLSIARRNKMSNVVDLLEKYQN